MNPEFEVHNFAENTLPRRYEAVYVKNDLLLKVVIAQHDQRTRQAKPSYKWYAAALAWTPGQGDDSHYTELCHLSRAEMVVREVRGDGTASQEDWLDAARIDAEKLTERAEVYLRVLASAVAGGRKKARA